MTDTHLDLNTDVRNFTREFVKHAMELDVDIEIDRNSQQILGIHGITDDSKEELISVLNNIQSTLIDMVEDSDPIMGILQTINYFREYLSSRTLDQLNQVN